MKKLFFLLGATLLIAGITTVQAQTTSPQAPASTSPSTQTQPATTPGTATPSQALPPSTAPSAPSPASGTQTSPGSNDLGNGTGAVNGSQTGNSSSMQTEKTKTSGAWDKPKKTKKVKTTTPAPATGDQLTSPSSVPPTK